MGSVLLVAFAKSLLVTFLTVVTLTMTLCYFYFLLRASHTVARDSLMSAEL